LADAVAARNRTKPTAMNVFFIILDVFFILSSFLQSRSSSIYFR
jgi:hypothetical protein